MTAPCTSGCGPCRLCIGAYVNNPAPPTRKTRNMTTPDTGTLPGTALETYGHVLTGDVGRDAIHLAVKAVQTDQRLFPGQHVGLNSAGKATAVGADFIGIVDPFLDGGVFPGQWFWLTLYPRTITSLRHEWTHPAFPEDGVTIIAEDPKSVSERWLRNYAEEIDETLNTLLEAAGDWVERGEWFMGAERHGYHGKFEGMSTHPEFWHHYQVYKGVVVDPDRQENFFTCSC